MSTPAASANRRHILIVLLACNLSIPFFMVMQVLNTDLSLNAFILSACLSTVVLNAAILVGLQLRYKRQGSTLPRKAIILTLALAAFSAITSTVAITITRDQNSYIKLAQSSKPLADIKPERRRLVVELIRQRMQDSAENVRIAKSIKPIDPPLYSASSFANRSVIESTSSQLKADYNLDLDYQQKITLSEQVFETKMQSVDSSYLASWKLSMQPKDQQNATLMANEKSWVDSVLKLYAFAGDHLSEIRIAKDSVILSNATDNNTFAQLLSDSKTLNKTMADARQKAVTDQQPSRTQMGLPPAM